MFLNHIPEQLRCYKTIQRSKKVRLICKHKIPFQISSSAYRRIHLQLNKTVTVGFGKHPKTTIRFQKYFNVQWRKSGPHRALGAEGCMGWRGVQTYEVTKLFTWPLLDSHVMADGRILRDLGVTSIIIIDPPLPQIA
jgi:hypothetical protein